MVIAGLTEKARVGEITSALYGLSVVLYEWLQSYRRFALSIGPGIHLLMAHFVSGISAGPA